MLLKEYLVQHPEVLLRGPELDLARARVDQVPRLPERGVRGRTAMSAAAYCTEGVRGS